MRGPKIPGFIYTAARSPAGARRGADGVGRQCVGQPSQPGAVVVVQQSKNESLYDARKANEPPGPQPLSGRWERARGRSEGIFGHFCLSQFGLSAAHEQVQPSFGTRRAVGIIQKSPGVRRRVKGRSDDIFAVHFSLVSSYGGLWQGGARQGKVAYGKMARRRSNLPGLLN